MAITKLSISDLVRILKKMVEGNETYAVLKFGFLYWEALIDLSSEDRKKIISDCELKPSMNVELKKGIELGKYNKKINIS